MSKRRKRKLVPGIGWVTPKPGYCWTMAGNRVRQSPPRPWGARKYPEDYA